MSADIVARLRVWIDQASQQGVEEAVKGLTMAADTIERLDAKAFALEYENERLRGEIERLREELTASHESHGNEVGSLTERLSLAIHERDEARRDRCMARAVIRWDLEHPNSPQRSETTIILLAWQIADEQGWDCFKGRKR